MKGQEEQKPKGEEPATNGNNEPIPAAQGDGSEDGRSPQPEVVRAI